MEKNQRDHEKKLKDVEHEKRESGNNRYTSSDEEKSSITERGQPERNSTEKNSSGKISDDPFNAGGNDSDYDGGHPADVSSDKR
ncbi:hypothetical protein [Planococcus sp. NCCP-2050]|uniref:hypothetical protein n=1 Tax=Planococcus sp. NCCP-2050 TaxID=2944679 RepID=UPI00203DEA5A|nr:hypothetical protein [Planococcus sp. NCCP-2050]GKW45670.1 hypothetical protein NCCP2050_13620 [Planococcus sp. NCCP-2050]